MKTLMTIAMKKSAFYSVILLMLWGSSALAQTDHSQTKMGFYGNGYEGGAWDQVRLFHEPEVDGHVYTWSWSEITLIGGEERAFIFLEKLESELWGGLQVNYEQANIVQGSAIDNGNVVDERTLGRPYANFGVVSGGIFDLKLEYDASNQESIVTIDVVSDALGATKMGLFGNAFAGGNWEEVSHYHLPEFDGTLYTWSWNEMDLIGGDGYAFIFLEKLESGVWGGLQFDYEQANIVQGSAIDNGSIVNERSVGGDYANFHVAQGGTYDIILEFNGTDGNVTINESGDDVSVGLEESPVEYSLHQNYPNPFNPTTDISFYLPVQSEISLTVYNLLGQQVSQLVTGILSEGKHSVNFDASDLSSGIYIYRLQAGSFVQSKHMMLVK